MDPDEIQLGVVYRNERAGFDVWAIPNPRYRRPGDVRYLVQTRANPQWPWAPAVSECATAESARAKVATYLNWDRDPSSPR
jgi:hypothetical protein